MADLTFLVQEMLQLELLKDEQRQDKERIEFLKDWLNRD
jgi:hypothetical protein